VLRSRCPVIDLASLRAASITLASLISLVATPVRAQSGTPQPGDAVESDPTTAPAAPVPEDPARMAQARERFQAGREHFQAQRYREAVRDFELAASLYPSAEISFNIALCYEQLQEYDPAIQYLQRYLRDKVDPPDRAEVEARIIELQRLREIVRQSRRQRSGQGLLRVVTTGPHLAVRIDGGPPMRAPVSDPQPVHPTSTLVAEAPGMQRFVARVGAQPGEVSTALVRLEPETRYRTRHTGRVWTWIVGGAALATAGAGVYFGARSVSQSADAGDLVVTDPTRAANLYDDAARNADTADALYGTALLVTLGAVILWFAEGTSAETEQIR
jgi:hypothetical protein